MIASFPDISATTNPYQRLLYDALQELGFGLAPPARLRLLWLWKSRNTVGCLHFHWLTLYYHHESWIGRLGRLLLLAQRLMLARLLGYRIVWTVHEIDPHTRRSRADKIAPHLVSRFAHQLIVHDEPTRRKVLTRLGRSAVVIPVGSYANVYPSGRTRAAVREELGVSDDVPVVLVFGHVSRYKSVDSLIHALRLVPGDEEHQVVVLVAGRAMDPDVAEALHVAAHADERLRLWLRFIPDEEVVPLFDASDVAAMTRVDDGTSGVLVLALSLGVPVIVADIPGYRKLTQDTGVKSWYFEAGDDASLATAISTAARELRSGPRPDRSVGPAGPAWAQVAERTAEVLVPNG